ncbi:MAG: ECF transporter S component [Faecalibacterium sp.]
MKNRNHSRNAVVAAMLSAVAFVLMFIQFPIPMLIPAFVQMDISDLPALIGAFALSPVYGIVICLLKNILHIVIKGSTTAGVGEICNFLLGATFTFTAGFIYHRNKSRKGAIIGSVVGAVLMGLLSVPINFYITYPTYEIAYGMPMEVILSMYQAILPSVETLLECLVIFNLPFTIFKGLCSVVLCYLVYKPLSPLLHGKR